MLPHILSRAGPLPASHAEDGEPIRPGRIYVAPPDRQMTIQDGVVRVTRGPRENRHRPAIDPLFRTAAREHDTRVIGVILTGQLDDGAAGLHAIRARGGIAIVQDPKDAPARQMPESALKYGGADYVLPAAQIGPRVVALVDSCERDSMKEKKPNHKTAKKQPTNDVEENLEVSRPNEGHGVPSPFSCPECGGVLWELKNGQLVRFRCRVGHAYTMASLSEEQGDGAEAALWAAMRALEEKAALATRIAESTTDGRTRERLLEQAESDRHYADKVRNIIFSESDQAESKSA